MKSKKNLSQNIPNQPIEFLGDPTLNILFVLHELPLGRNISQDRSNYCKTHEGDLVIFNANIITRHRGKIWYGDLNINLDFDNLKEIADKLKEDLYVLMEGDARFGYEKEHINKLIKKARTVIKCNIKYNNIK